jgi:GrpB-like predicted nucleotidyltransferase (UPF0157 family)
LDRRLHRGARAFGCRSEGRRNGQVGVAPLSDWQLCHDPLLALGYDYAENAGVPGHYIFGRGRDATERTHLVHVVEYLGQSWRSNLALRDALRNDEGLRRSYIAEKERAVAAAPVGRGRYNELKGAFIDEAKARLRAAGPASEIE